MSKCMINAADKSSIKLYNRTHLVLLKNYENVHIVIFWDLVSTSTRDSEANASESRENLEECVTYRHL